MSPQYHTVSGAINAKWQALGEKQGILGDVITDEEVCADQVTHLQTFQKGRIFWRPGLGAFAMLFGPIYDKWSYNGRLTGALGHPTSDELPIPGGTWHKQCFQHGIVFFCPGVGAMAVFGSILNTWLSLGGYSGELGYPFDDMVTVFTRGGERVFGQRFDNGSITNLGHEDIYADVISAGLSDGTSLPRTSYRLSLEDFTHSIGIPNDLWVRFVVDSNFGKVSSDYRHPVDTAKIKPNLILYEANLPETLHICVLALVVNDSNLAQNTIAQFSNSDDTRWKDQHSPGFMASKLFHLLLDSRHNIFSKYANQLPPLHVTNDHQTNAIIAADKIPIVSALNVRFGMSYHSEEKVSYVREGHPGEWRDLEIVGMLNYEHCENGDILEKRHYYVGSGTWDYEGYYPGITLTLRHHFGSLLPNPPYGLSYDSHPVYSYNPEHPERHVLLYVDVHVFWMVSSLFDSGYELERSRDGQAFTKITNVNAHVPSTEGANYVDRIFSPDPQNNEEIRYRIRGYNKHGYGAYSEVLAVTLV